MEALVAGNDAAIAAGSAPLLKEDPTLREIIQWRVDVAFWIEDSNATEDAKAVNQV